MTLRITPDDSNRGPSSETSDQNLSYGDSSNSELESGYIPEREFVLMPLFRRIGQMFGLRRNEEPEYVYTPEGVAPPPSSVTEGGLASAPVQISEILEEAPVPLRSVTEDILGIEPETARQATVVEQSSVTQPEPAIMTHERFEPVTEESAEHSIEEPALSQSAGLQQDEFKPEAIEEPEAISSLPMAAHSDIVPPAIAVAPMTRQDVQDLAAQIREATARISAVVTQAAAWLQTKEEEILRRAEMPLEPEKPLETRSQTARLDPVPIIPLPTPAHVSDSEKDLVPALQREVAWHSKREQSSTVTAQPLTSGSRKSRLSLVSKPAAALASWRRIDWAQQFEPKRVAILGAAIMAILLVLGISLARRPAADELPRQTRAIEHGGVTLTTHPQSGNVTRQAQSERRPASNKPAPHSQARRPGNHDNGPDVVTHYYGSKPKPSPIPQTASSGVRHYSDMPY